MQHEIMVPMTKCIRIRRSEGEKLGLRDQDLAGVKGRLWCLSRRCLWRGLPEPRADDNLPSAPSFSRHEKSKRKQIAPSRYCQARRCEMDKNMDLRILLVIFLFADNPFCKSRLPFPVLTSEHGQQR